MNAVTVVSGAMAPLDRADVDTDQIMPKQFLKRIERTGFDRWLFHDWRSDPDFVLNRPEHAHAKVLVSGPNFGCGSSREHAPWGLQQWGFEAVVAPSFADIFRTNCAKIGLPAVVVPTQVCDRLIDIARTDPTTLCRIDLPARRLQAGEVDETLQIDAHTRLMLMQGLDEIALTLRDAEAITAFESRRARHLPLASLG